MTLYAAGFSLVLNYVYMRLALNPRDNAPSQAAGYHMAKQVLPRVSPMTRLFEHKSLTCRRITHGSSCVQAISLVQVHAST